MQIHRGPQSSHYPIAPYNAFPRPEAYISRDMPHVDIMNSSSSLTRKTLSLNIMLPITCNPQRLAHFKSSLSLAQNLTRSINMIRLKSSLPAVAVGAVAWIGVDRLHRVALAVLNMSILEQTVVWKVLSWVVPGDNESGENDRNEL